MRRSSFVLVPAVILQTLLLAACGDSPQTPDDTEHIPPVLCVELRCEASHRSCIESTGEEHDASCGDCLVGFHEEDDACVEDASPSDGTCDKEPTICGPGQCQQRETSYHCACDEGYAFDGTSCVDIDECEADEPPCDDQCTNTDGSYVCACHDGFKDFGGGCERVFSQVSAGTRHSCAISEDKLYCWGNETRRRPNDGTVAVLTPTQVKEERPWSVVDGGYMYSCGISEELPICWGTNPFGPLQPPTKTPRSGWTHLAVGDFHTCGIADGTLHCWGANESGQLGDAGLDALNNDRAWTHVAASEAHSCGISNGALYCWGKNDFAQLGNGTQTSTSTPQNIGPEHTWSDLSIGFRHSCGIADGTIYCWGNNTYGELGLGDNDVRPTLQPTAILSDRTWTSVRVGAQNTCGLSDGHIYCWGLLQSDGSSRSFEPLLINDERTWSSIDMGSFHSCAISEGKIYCWGENDEGQTGIGQQSTYVDAPTPITPAFE